jgi:hypothetical protein
VIKKIREDDKDKFIAADTRNSKKRNKKSKDRDKDKDKEKKNKNKG